MSALASLPNEAAGLACSIDGDFLYTAGGINSRSTYATAQKLDLR